MPEQLILEPVGPPAVEAVTISRGRAVVIGRSAGCEVRLADDAVSRRHASIEWQEAAWFVTDLDSRQGTILGGERLAAGKPAILRGGDRLQVGPYVFQVTLSGPRQAGVFGGRAAGGRDPVVTRPSIFLRLRADETAVRDVSWAEFERRYAPIIVGFARNLGLSGQDADDVLQEVMLAFFRVSPRFEYTRPRAASAGT